MFMTVEIGKRIEYGAAEAKRIEQTLAEARRMADNVTSVVNEVATTGYPLSQGLAEMVASCKAQINGAIMSSGILSTCLGGFFQDPQPYIPLLVDKSDILFGIHCDLTRAVEAAKSAHRRIYTDTYGDERDHYARAVSRALTVLEGLLRQVTDSGSAGPKSAM